jgi:hypothetical protein
MAIRRRTLLVIVALAALVFVGLAMSANCCVVCSPAAHASSEARAATP